MKAPAGHFPWERLIACLIGCAMIWWFLRTHRDWVWAYFDTMLLMPNANAAVASVAEKSISAVTTVALTAMTMVGAVVIWFLTGSTSVLTSMFKFSGITNTAASVSDISQTLNETKEETIREFNTPELQDRYGDR